MTEKKPDIIGADFSETEARLLAHYTGVPVYDIYTVAAADHFRVPYDMVSPTQRRAAKALAYSTAYSPKGRR